MRAAAYGGVWVGLAAVAALAVPAAAGAATCPPVVKAQADAAAVMRGMYASATADDEAGFNAVIAPDFYAFDGGRRFSGPELFALIKAAHAAGKTYVWTVPSPQVHVVCDIAWLTYENQGSVSDAFGKRPTAWLESAVLRYEGSRWRIAFFHSTVKPPAH